MLFWHDILVFLHLMGLVVGLGLGVANMFIVRQANSTEKPEIEAVLRALPMTLSRISTMALGVLVVTGILLLFDSLSPNPFGDFWFWLKLVATAGMIAVSYLVLQAQAQIRRGETPQFAAWLPRVGPIMGGLAVLATVFAVLVFH